MSLTDAENRQAVEFIKQAHLAEFSANFKQAYDLHIQAARLLTSFIARAQKKSEERRRAKLNLRASTDRQNVLRPCVQGSGPPPPGPLPSLITVEAELKNPLPGTVLISLVQMGRLPTLFATPGLPDQPPQQLPNEFLTNLLSPSLPDVTYHIYCEKFQRFNKGLWFYFHIKDDKKTTLYTLSALKQPRFQIPLVAMSRAAEYHSNCATITVTPVKPRDTSSEGGAVGRALHIQNGTQKVIPDAPDRVEKDWTPRRFIYGGRRFVWKERKGVTNFVENLYEVLKEWPDPESKTGKILEQTHARPLLWGDTKYAMEKVCTIHMVGGLDQMFREFLLASQVTRQLIALHGHS